VVSIKPSNPDAVGPFGGPAMPVILPPVGGRFTASNVPLRHLVDFDRSRLRSSPNSSPIRFFTNKVLLSGGDARALQ
jgi:hypothetical protein